MNITFAVVCLVMLALILGCAIADLRTSRRNERETAALRLQVGNLISGLQGTKDWSDDKRLTEWDWRRKDG